MGRKLDPEHLIEARDPPRDWRDRATRALVWAGAGLAAVAALVMLAGDIECLGGPGSVG